MTTALLICHVKLISSLLCINFLKINSTGNTKIKKFNMMHNAPKMESLSVEVLATKKAENIHPYSVFVNNMSLLVRA